MNPNAILTYIIKGIKDHPVQSLVTALTAIGVIFTAVSNTHVDLFITSQQVRANAQAISSLSGDVVDDHNNILILQQIAKDNVISQRLMAEQFQQLNATFQQFLLNKVK